MLKFVIMPPQNDIKRSWAKRLGETLSDVTVAAPETDAAAREEIVEADAAYGLIPPETLPLAKKIRWLQSQQIAPPDDYYYPALIEHPLVVTNPRGTFNDHIAQHIVMMMLALGRGLPYYMAAQQERRWDKDARKNKYIDLGSATVLIVGVGGIGQEAARLCDAFGMRIIGIDARWEYDLPFVEKHAPEALDEQLPHADFVVVTVPHTPQTEGMWHAARFEKMKKGAHFINIGRGKTTILADLVAALESGHLAGCSLDVYEIEPLPADHALWALPNVILTPHIAAEDADNIPERQYEILLDNIRRFAAGQELRNVVDKSVWY